MYNIEEDRMLHQTYSLAYTMIAFTSIGVIVIWLLIPVGWLLVDITGFWQLKRQRN